MSLEALVIRVVSEILCVPEQNITNNSSFVDLGADSLGSVELIMAIEEEFEVVITDEEAESMFTIQQMIDHVSFNRSKCNVS